MVPILLGDNRPCEGAPRNLKNVRERTGHGMPARFAAWRRTVPHETQAACIEALQSEIGRVRDILAALRPAGIDPLVEVPDNPAATTIRLSLD